MKKLICISLLIFSALCQANIFSQSQNELKIFKDYPFNMHKDDFLKKFSSFGACQVSLDVICAPKGYEKLYGIPFDINVQLEKNRTVSIKLHSTHWVDRTTYFEFYRGLFKSGFSLYQIKDKDGIADAIEEAFAQNGKKLENYNATIDEKLTKIETSEQGETELRLVESDKLQSLVQQGKKYSSSEQVISSLPKDTRFISVNITKIGKDDFIIGMIITIPKMQVTDIDDRPVEKF